MFETITPQLLCEFLCNNESNKTAQLLFIKLTDSQKPSNLIIINKVVLHNHNPNSTTKRKKKLLSKNNDFVKTLN